MRVWVLDAGIERSSSFHVIGGQFDTVWAEGRYLLNRSPDTGSQALGLMPAQGGFVELTFPEAGHYPFVSHFMIDAERGAHGIFDVRGESWAGPVPRHHLGDLQNRGACRASASGMLQISDAMRGGGSGTRLHRLRRCIR
ncbi:hypothetical protein L2X99_10695 [Microbacterium sp. KUDC0406]|uniref:hypothetical protein n=1 Tax=Microbacterium sp. KUDC0406 TaxID=2909588 RepID=UPI001F2F22EC|nr:hypothetical protein [Microbacterium sp. KUDC0406]UJP08946.1 hypothetical protein L2X99_10695 [Microbacterium sp. KUDC0406]